MKFTDFLEGPDILYLFVGIIVLTIIYAFIRFLVKKNRARFFERKLNAAWDNVLDQYKSTHQLEQAPHFEEVEGANKGDIFISSDAIHYLYRTRTIIENLKYDDLGVAFEIMKHKNPIKVIIPLTSIIGFKQVEVNKRSKRLTIRAHASPEEFDYVFNNTEMYQVLKERLPDKESSL